MGNPKLMYQLYETFFLKYLFIGEYFNDKVEFEKKEIFSKLAISMLGLIEKAKIDEYLTEKNIEAIWKDIVKKYC